VKAPTWLLLLSGCLPAHRQSQQDLERAPDREQFAAWSQEQGLVSEFQDFVDLLEAPGLAEVVEPWTLLRQGTDWHTVEHPPFAMPAREQWEAILPTLAFIQEHIEPQFGPVEVVSAFRTPDFNAAAGGSNGSRHKYFEALDLVPIEPIRRARLHAKLEALHSEQGEAHRLGLGLYENTRFHVDTWKLRRW